MARRARAGHWRFHPFLVGTAATDGGGGGAPAWVPEGAKIFIQTQAVDGAPEGRAWVEGTGEVAVDTLLGADPQTSQWSTTGAYDPGEVDANGWTSPDQPAALLGAAKTAVLAGSTVRLEFTLGGNNMEYTIGSEDGGVGMLPVASGTDLNIFGTAGDAGITVPGLVVGANIIAFTLTPLRVEGAVNGSSTESWRQGEMGEDDWPTSGGSQFAVAFLNWVEPLRSIAIYDPVPLAQLASKTT